MTLPRHLRIQVAGGFVGHSSLGEPASAARDRHALVAARRIFRRVVLHARTEAHQRPWHP